MTESDISRGKSRTWLQKTGYILSGGILGIVIGALLFISLIPLWHHAELDIQDYDIVEIVLVKFAYLDNSDPAQDTIYLQADNGEDYIYSEGKMTQGNAPVLDNTDGPYSVSPCPRLDPPPPMYLRSITDSVGVVFGHSLGNSVRCYLLLADGSLHVWYREYSVFDMMLMGLTTFVAGLGIGAVIERARRA